MPRCIFRYFFALAICAIGLNLAACTSGSSGKPIVLCSIFSYYDAARAIAADKLDVQILLPRSQSPHEYDATIDDKVTAAKTALYIKNGMGLDDRFDKLFDASKTKILNISSQIPKDLFLTTQEVSLDNKPAGSAPETLVNPHIWLDPQIQIKAAECIRDALIELDPIDKALFEQNTAKYVENLQKLDADFRAAAATFKIKDFIGFHSAYDYLAHRYGLRQIASIEEIPGSEPSWDQAQKIIQLIKDKNIHYIAVESAFSAQNGKKIEAETGVKEIVLQPLETYDDVKDTYESYMRQNLEALKTALGG